MLKSGLFLVAVFTAYLSPGFGIQLTAQRKHHLRVGENNSDGNPCDEDMCGGPERSDKDDEEMADDDVEMRGSDVAPEETNFTDHLAGQQDNLCDKDPGLNVGQFDTQKLVPQSDQLKINKNKFISTGPPIVPHTHQQKLYANPFDFTKQPTGFTVQPEDASTGQHALEDDMMNFNQHAKQPFGPQTHPKPNTSKLQSATQKMVPQTQPTLNKNQLDLRTQRWDTLKKEEAFVIPCAKALTAEVKGWFQGKDLFCANKKLKHWLETKGGNSFHVEELPLQGIIKEALEKKKQANETEIANLTKELVKDLISKKIMTSDPDQIKSNALAVSQQKNAEKAASERKQAANIALRQRQKNQYIVYMENKKNNFVTLDDILFTQHGITFATQDYNINDTVAQLLKYPLLPYSWFRNGPIVVIKYEDKYYSNDNRRLWAMKRVFHPNTIINFDCERKNYNKNGNSFKCKQHDNQVPVLLYEYVKPNKFGEYPPTFQGDASFDFMINKWDNVKKKAQSGQQVDVRKGNHHTTWSFQVDAGGLFFGNDGKFGRVLPTK